jgi:phosphoribosylamine-glycine ligase
MPRMHLDLSHDQKQPPPQGSNPAVVVTLAARNYPHQYLHHAKMNSDNHNGMHKTSALRMNVERSYDGEDPPPQGSDPTVVVPLAARNYPHQYLHQDKMTADLLKYVSPRLMPLRLEVRESSFSR